jgi:hypothetical protein
VYNIDLFTEAQRTLTEEILTKMVVNSASFWGGMPYPKDMAKLNYVTDYWFGVAAANKDGQHWRIASPKEKVTVWLDSLAVAADLAEDEQKVEAAYLLLDFMLSAETQAGIYQKFGSVIVSICNPSFREGISLTKPISGSPYPSELETLLKPCGMKP